MLTTLHILIATLLLAFGMIIELPSNIIQYIEIAIIR